VAQPQNDHVVVLTEVYRVSPTLPLQTYRFDKWTAGGGFTWPSQGLYRRRNTLQGHIIRAAHRNVSKSLLIYDKIKLSLLNLRKKACKREWIRQFLLLNLERREEINIDSLEIFPRKILIYLNTNLFPVLLCYLMILEISGFIFSRL